jgi:hypothetical protein
LNDAKAADVKDEMIAGLRNVSALLDSKASTDAARHGCIKSRRTPQTQRMKAVSWALVASKSAKLRKQRSRSYRVR